MDGQSVIKINLTEQQIKNIGDTTYMLQVAIQLYCFVRTIVILNA